MPSDQLLVWFVFLRGIQKAERFGSFALVNPVVNVVCPDDAVQIPVIGLEFDPDPAVNDDIMENKVKNPVERHPDADGGQKPERIDFKTDHHQPHGEAAEQDAEQVISLQKTGVVIVVRMVPAPHKTVHDVLVRPPGDAFHDDKCNQRNNNVYQHFFVSKVGTNKSLSHTIG